jgi:hypothetical protein
MGVRHGGPEREDVNEYEAARLRKISDNNAM